MIPLYFRILRLKDKYEIDRRIFFKYYPFVYVHTFQACLGFIGDYCYQIHCTKSIVPNNLGYDITLTARIDGTDVASYLFQSVPITANKIEAYEGTLFGEITHFTPITIGFTINPEWGDTTIHEF